MKYTSLIEYYMHVFVAHVALSRCKDKKKRQYYS